MKIESRIQMSSLLSGFTKKHFTELKVSGVCTCICPECGIASVKHLSTQYSYGPDKVLCVVKEAAE